MTDRTIEAPATEAPAIEPSATRRRLRRAAVYLWIAPAAVMYAVFALYPLAQALRYSFYDWDGIGPATWAGFDNYVSVITDPQLYGSLRNTLTLILFFCAVPVALGLLAAAAARAVGRSGLVSASRTVLFLPQIVPFAAAAVAWTWMYADTGPINEVLRAVGAGGLARPWLGDFTTALPAIGIIGSWVMIGFCTVVFSAGMGRIDASLYEAARLDGANAVQEFFAVTLPGLRHEVVVCVTVTLIAAIASFDLVYMTTQGGPGYTTMVPGVQIVRLAFTENRVGLASALAIVLLVIIVAIVLPVQRLNRERGTR
ncbi:carbohydrate ABC transporter permease [Agromyces silvae]|uniref:carbohydrate ABC transporter permease n=1 Tax=Agromyces silvae TaxID=3388266 RepID=UPI00280B550B|nr:sugar ABC transporter permease [Agromyces protaetiae]